ncbi:DUF4276 family protein [Microbacteriaceae bacterium VKM Ac-2855]|nr:DUF4276 family protein [Microbacteriaceae bacterium VKM Ac-2855]
MGLRYFNVGVEDELSEAVIRRLIKPFHEDLIIGTVLSKGGYGYLRSNVQKFAQASQHMPMLILTDLDNRECAPTLLDDWMGRVSFEAPDLHIRVAVREVEAWLIADIENLRHLLQRPGLQAPSECDDIGDPKAWLLNEAARAPRAIQSQLLRRDGTNLRQGLGYNNILSNFVENDWQPEHAATRSDSLRRTIDAIRRLAERT